MIHTRTYLATSISTLLFQRFLQIPPAFHKNQHLLPFIPVFLLRSIMKEKRKGKENEGKKKKEADDAALVNRLLTGVTI